MGHDLFYDANLDGGQEETLKTVDFLVEILKPYPAQYRAQMSIHETPPTLGTSAKKYGG